MKNYNYILIENKERGHYIIWSRQTGAFLGEIISIDDKYSYQSNNDGERTLTCHLHDILDFIENEIPKGGADEKTTYMD